MSKCEICGEKLANSSDGYKIHIKRFHSLPSSFKSLTHIQLIKPVKLTDRSKAQIVHDIEKTWGCALFPQVKPWHTLADSRELAAC